LGGLVFMETKFNTIVFDGYNTQPDVSLWSGGNFRDTIGNKTVTSINGSWSSANAQTFLQSHENL
jgi:hypothetical protein